MTRDPKRIFGIMYRIADLWEKSPDLRFFQFIAMLEKKITVLLEGYATHDLFYLEDDILLKALEKLMKDG